MPIHDGRVDLAPRPPLPEGEGENGDADEEAGVRVGRTFLSARIGFRR